VFFDESSRLRINYEKGLVRLSIKASDYSVDEFTIPYSDFDAFYEYASSGGNYDSDNIKIKWSGRSAIVQIRESIYKRRIFKLSESKINKILSQFGAEKIGYIDWLSENTDRATELTSDFIFKSATVDSEELLLIRSLDEKLDKVIDICINLGLSMEKIFAKLKELEQKKQNVVIDSSNVQIKSTDGILLSDDNEHFIPNDLNVNFKGTMSSETTSSDETATDAVEALKKLRGKKK
tara:strand:- start:196 stop:903 length:708 start_codon:yes stop_codon:yes gene_type:complete